MGIFNPKNYMEKIDFKLIDKGLTRKKIQFKKPFYTFRNGKIEKVIRKKRCYNNF